MQNFFPPTLSRTKEVELEFSVIALELEAIMEEIKIDLTSKAPERTRDISLVFVSNFHKGTCLYIQSTNLNPNCTRICKIYLNPNRIRKHINLLLAN